MALHNRDAKSGRVVLFVFAIPFTLVGIGMLVLAVVPNLYDWIRMQSWVPVEAQLISADLKRHPAKKSTTYEVEAQYRYSYEGGSYFGKRVGISEKSDNLGDWHERTYARLRAMQPLQVWVNPRDPRESIFDRDLRWTKLGFYMIFVLAFGGIGAGMMWWALRKPVEIPDGVPLWLGYPAWRDNQIRSNAKAGVWIIWVFTAFWILITSPVIFVVPREWAKGNDAILLALLFPLVGIGLIAFAMKRTMEWRRFGVTPLRLDPFPGSIGGEVGGSIRVNQVVPRDAIANVQLSCVYVYTRNSGNDSETRRDIKWQDQQQVNIEPGINGSLIKFRFTTPDDLPDSEVMRTPSHEWILEVTSKLPGVDLNRTYVIPVFKTDTPRQSARWSNPVEHSSGMISVPTRIMQVSQTGNGLHLHFPIFRGRSAGFTFTLVGAMFVGFAGLFTFGNMKQPPPVIFHLVFGGLGSLALLGGLYTLGNSLSVVANAAEIVVTRRVFGLAFNKRVPTATIKSFQVAKGLESTQGNKTVLSYMVKAYTRDGKKITVAESLPGITVAEQVARQIKAACNIRS